jgi:RNA polymerase sigma factor (sigma-70 family)
MLLLHGQTTDPDLLGRLGDWTDHPAWSEFVARYDPEIRQSCRQFRLDPEAQQELCQRIWIELAGRMRAYRHDPAQRFRPWLRRLCWRRAIDFWRQRRNDPLRRGLPGLDDLPAEPPPADDDPDENLPELLRRADRVQEAVRRRVDDKAWRIFWAIAVDGQSVRDTAEAAGLSYAAAFAAQKRVRRMLREEAARLGLDRAADPRP